MKNKGIGTIFCLMSSMLMSARYIATAIYLSGASSWNKTLFTNGLDYVGTPLQTASLFALIVGIIFLAVGLYQDFKEWKKK